MRWAEGEDGTAGGVLHIWVCDASLHLQELKNKRCGATLIAGCCLCIVRVTGCQTKPMGPRVDIDNRQTDLKPPELAQTLKCRMMLITGDGTKKVHGNIDSLVLLAFIYEILVQILHGNKPKSNIDVILSQILFRSNLGTGTWITGWFKHGHQQKVEI